jgi:biopolymer transport protein ExbD
MAVDFGRKNKVDASFNMASMTDIIFLLLIFFMLTSNFATPSGLRINVPTSKASAKVVPTVNISVTKDLKYYLNSVEIPLDILEEELRYTLSQNNAQAEETTIVLRVDKDVPVQYLVNVAGIAAKLRAKVTIAALPE